MALYFDNVTLLSYQHTPVFFDAGIRFKVQKNFSIDGVLLAEDNDEGAEATWTKAQLLQLMAEDYQPILLNGVDFGKGKITNIAFEQGDHVKKQRYTYQIQAYSEGNLFNVTTDEYAGIDWEGDAIHCVDRLEESFSYSESEVGNKSYEHSINVKFNRDVENLGVSPLDLAKILATDFMAATNLTLFLGQYNLLNSLKTTSTETYSLIDYSCAFVRRTEIPNEFQEDYSISRQYSLQQDSQGIVTVSEKGSIKGLVHPASASATTGYYVEADETDAYSRANDIYEAYEFSEMPLHNVVIQKSVAINKFTGEIEYNLTFTNDPRINELAIWDYTIQLSRSSENYIEVSENGAVKGLGRPHRDKYPNAVAFYESNVKPTIENRIRDAYTQFGGIHESNLIRIRIGHSVADFAGEISYGETWTDNNLYVNDANIRKVEIEVVTEYPVHLTFTIPVVNVKEIIQPQNTSTPGRRSVSIKLKGVRSTTLDQYISYAKSLISDNSYDQIGDDTFIADCQYNVSPIKNDFNMSVEFSFHGFYKAFGALTLT